MLTPGVADARQRVDAQLAEHGGTPLTGAVPPRISAALLAAAARGYFGRAPDELTWAQASMLVGLVQAPSAYDPCVHPDRAGARQAHVLDRLVAVGTLTRAEADRVAAEPRDLSPRS